MRPCPRVCDCGGEANRRASDGRRRAEGGLLRLSIRDRADPGVRHHKPIAAFMKIMLGEISGEIERGNAAVCCSCSGAKI
jgi:hypothetical protein